MNKRDFMMAGGSALVAGGSWAAGSGTAASSAPVAAPADMAGWQALIGQTFDVRALASAHQLCLQDVQPVHSNLADASTEQFTLIFAQTEGTALSAGTQLLQAQAGSQVLPVFLVDAGQDERGRALHRADFNQLA